MLRIKVEIVPFGDEAAAKIIHTINVGKKTFGNGLNDYRVKTLAGKSRCRSVTLKFINTTEPTVRLSCVVEF